MSVDVIGERPTNGRPVQRGVGPVQPPARVEVATSAAAPWRRSMLPGFALPPGEVAPLPRGSLSEAELFFAYRHTNDEGDG